MKKIFLIFFLLFFRTAYADINCQPWNPFTGVISLNSSPISVGVDMPVGSILYRAQYRAGGSSGVTCDAPITQLEGWVNYRSTPLPLSSWTGNGLGGKVYETGVPGIGVIITQLNGDIPTYIFPIMENIFTGNGSITGLSVGHGYTIWLIKTGPISSGTIYGSNLPTVQAYIPPTAGYTGFPLIIGTLSFTGSLIVINNTCVTPDVNVELGSHDIREFTGIGSSTPWVASSIILNSCPPFRGYYGKGNYSLQLTGSGAITDSGERTNNLLDVALTPGNAVINSQEGIMAVSTLTSDPVASGVGIQLGWGGPAQAVPFNFGLNKVYIPTFNSSASSYEIPLSARYIQTDGKVLPGRADGKIVFTINYY